MANRFLKSGSRWLLVVFCLLPLIGCGKKEEKQAKERLANVRVTQVEKKALRPFVETIGTLKASEEVTVSSEVEGIIKNIHVDESVPVARGDILAVLADTDYDLEVKRSEAVLKQADASCANTKLEHQRKEALYKEELVTKQQFDDVATRLSLAAAECDRAKVGLSLAREKLAKTKVYSPLRGVIKEKKVSAGDYVKNATPLFSIINTDTLKLDFTITEKDAGRIRTGQEVRFQVDSMPGREYNGRVSLIYPNLEERTRTLMVEALVPNHDKTLKPGMFTRVIIYLGSPRETIVIPVNSILYEGTKIRVFVVEGDKAYEREVKIGGKYGDLMEITEGLKGKETVVTVGQNNLAEGVKVNVAR